MSRSDDLDNMHRSGTAEREINAEQQAVPSGSTGIATVPMPNGSFSSLLTMLFMFTWLVLILEIEFG